MMSFIQDRKFKIFIDFDGTVTKKDIGEHMFLKFGDADKAYEIIKRWMNNEISSADTWVELCATVKNIDMAKFDSFLSEAEIEEGFSEFVEFCKMNNCEIKILSDGLDYYIDKILSDHGFNNIEYFSNKLVFDENNNLIPNFPYTDEECKICANCKRNHILNNSSDDDFTIYIGDGLSDTCPAQFVDFIFAKRSLLKFCEKNRISYFPYNNFYDIKNRLDELMKKKRIKKRHQAELKRREVYIQG